MMIPFTSFLGSVNTSVSPLIHPQDSPSVLNGVTNAWKLGALTKDTGYSRVAGQVQSGKVIGGLYHFIQSSSVEKMLATVDNSGSTATKLWYRADGAGAWTEIAAAAAAWTTAGHTVEMVGFIGYAFFVGYSSSAAAFLPVGSLTGTTFSTSTNVTDMPQGKYIVKYRDRLYVLNCYYGATAYPFRVVASAPVTAGAIAWSTSGSPTSSTGGFLDVDYNLSISGGASIWDKLIIFTEYNAYFYDQSSFKEVWALGCSNHRTIRTHGSYLIWANMDGVWISTGGQPQNIAGQVIDFIRNGNPRNFFAEIVDEVYHLNVGTVTVNGVTYTNCVLKFNIAVSTWEWREYFEAMSVFARYNSSGKRRLYMGDTTGTVWDKGKYTDATLVNGDSQTTAGTGGNPINATFELAPIFLQTQDGRLNALSDVKAVKQVIAYADRAQNVALRCRAVDRNLKVLTPYFPLGRLSSFVNSFNTSINDGVFLQIQGTESSASPYFSFYGYALDIEKHSRILKKSLK